MAAAALCASMQTADYWIRDWASPAQLALAVQFEEAATAALLGPLVDSQLLDLDLGCSWCWCWCCQEQRWMPVPSALLALMTGTSAGSGS